MADTKTNRLERLIVMSARHLPRRSDIREREWLGHFDELHTQGTQARFAAECLVMASSGFLRATLLQLSRIVLILTMIALPFNWVEIMVDWTVLPTLGIFMLMLLPSTQRQAFDAYWYPAIRWSTWIWRASAAAWFLLFLSSVFVAHDYVFAAGFGILIVVMHRWDVDRILSFPKAN